MLPDNGVVLAQLELLLVRPAVLSRVVTMGAHGALKAYDYDCLSFLWDDISFPRILLGNTVCGKTIATSLFA